MRLVHAMHSDGPLPQAGIKHGICVQNSVVIYPVWQYSSSDLGTRNAGEACSKLEGQIQPASKCCCIKVTHASWYVLGVA